MPRALGETWQRADFTRSDPHGMTQAIAVATQEEHLIDGAPGVVHPTVMVVDGSPIARETLGSMLAQEGFQVVTAGGSVEAVRLTKQRHPDAIILEMELPGIGGLGTLSALRAACDAPVVVVSARDDAGAPVRALEAGADDYLPKPCSMDELSARIRAVLRRRRGRTAPSTTLHVGGLELDFERRMCRRDGIVVPLARSEWRVLSHLARNSGRVVIATELLRQCWGPGYQDDLQVLRICVSRLRRKLGATSRSGPIRTYHNVGYALEG